MQSKLTGVQNTLDAAAMTAVLIKGHLEQTALFDSCLALIGDKCL